MFVKSLIIATVVLCATVTARTVREAPKEVELPTTFEELLENAEKAFKAAEKNIFDFFKVENSEQLQQKALESGKEYANKLDEWAVDVKKQTEGLKDSDLVKNLRETVDKQVEAWKAKNPETAEDFKKYLETANEGAAKIMNKFKELSESKEAQDIKALGSKLAESAVKTFDELRDNLKEKINEKKD